MSAVGVQCRVLKVEGLLPLGLFSLLPLSPPLRWQPDMVHLHPLLNSIMLPLSLYVSKVLHCKVLMLTIVYFSRHISHLSLQGQVLLLHLDLLLLLLLLLTTLPPLSLLPHCNLFSCHFMLALAQPLHLCVCVQECVPMPLPLPPLSLLLLLPLLPLLPLLTLLLLIWLTLLTLPLPLLLTLLTLTLTLRKL